MSALYQKYDANDEQPQNAGYVLGTAVLISYLCCGPFFILSGNEYKKEYLRREADKIRADFDTDESGKGTIQVNCYEDKPYVMRNPDASYRDQTVKVNVYEDQPYN